MIITLLQSIEVRFYFFCKERIPVLPNPNYYEYSLA
jgi:hypothetical protein